MIAKVLAMPENQWFTMDDITGGVHSPSLWKYLCHKDADGYIRDDGARLVGNHVRLKFMWQKK